MQLTQLEILKVIDKFCRTHGLKYSLYAGTLIGAVRHKGFIPWDDDLDIAMERSEYMCFSEWDAYLRCRYNDYMQLPPESERSWKHHPIIIDFEHNLEDITEDTKSAIKILF